MDYSIGNIVNKILLTMYEARWVLEAVGNHSAKYMAF